MSKLTKTSARVLKRRIQRFNENNPERSIQVPAKITTEYQYRTLNSKLDREVKLSTTNNKIKDIVSKELQTRITSIRDLSTVEPMKHKLFKTQKAADKELERVRSVRKEQLRFIAAQKRFVDRVEKYNATLGSKHERRFSFLPRNYNELSRAKEAFKAAKKENTDGVRRAFNLSKEKTTRVMDSGISKYNIATITSAAETKSFNKTGGIRISDVRLQHSFRSALASTNLPELVELVDEGGISFINDLQKGGYQIDTIYQDMLFEEVRTGFLVERIAAALYASRTNASPRSIMILEKFIERHKDII